LVAHKIIFLTNKWYSFIQIDKVYQYNTNSKSLKTKRWICDQTHNIHVKSIKWQCTYAYKYDYIQVSRSATLTTPKPLIGSALGQS